LFPLCYCIILLLPTTMSEVCRCYPQSLYAHAWVVHYSQVRNAPFQAQREGTRWRTGGEVKGKLANGVGSQYPSLPRNMVYPALLPLMRTPRLPVVDWNDAPADLNGLVRFAERKNLVSVRVPSRFKCSLPLQATHHNPNTKQWDLH